jgi:hypothetical protein
VGIIHAILPFSDSIDTFFLAFVFMAGSLFLFRRCIS